MTATHRLRAVTMLIGLPAMTWYVWLCLRFFGGSLLPPAVELQAHSLADYLPKLSLTPIVMYASWLTVQALLYIVLPGRSAEGTVLPDGSRLVYRLNGWSALVCTGAILYGAVRFGGLRPWIAYDELAGLLICAHIAAFAIAAVVYLRARPHEASRSDVLTDYLMGASLNPRLRRFDVKFFCESRPGLLLWVVLNASCAAKQYELNGLVTTPMILVNAFQLLYVVDYFLYEDAILTTWDIKHERFGWMLCWGCLVWVPFMYSIQAQYLVTHTHGLSLLGASAIVALNMIGYGIFRTANLQKHRFRRDPTTRIWGRSPVFIRTGTGALILTSGWWGVSRHMNYFGDLLMALAWCLPTGFAHPLPYFYAVYVAILLIHRERRDHRMCLSKYGREWEAYCRKVQWRIVPGLY